MRKYNLFAILLVIISLAVVPSCSSIKKAKDNIASKFTKDDDKPADSEPAEKLYNDAMDLLNNRKFSKAIEKFSEIERVHPFSPLAVKGQLMTAYAHYENYKYDDAIAVLERYIKLHPGNKDIAYAYYLKALCYYDQIADVRRDQGYTELSKSSLKEVVVRFPESEYARDAQIKLDLVLDHLAGKEVEVGRFYLKQHRPLAAINRFKIVISDYQTTSHVPEALHRLVEAYMTLGVEEEAKKYAAVLGYNYPGSKWYEKSYRLIEGKELSSDKQSLPSWVSNVPDIFKNPF